MKPLRLASSLIVFTALCVVLWRADFHTIVVMLAIFLVGLVGLRLIDRMLDRYEARTEQLKKTERDGPQ